MSLIKAGLFNHFDYQGFMREKRVRATSIKPWKDFETKKILGTKVEGGITFDKTDYQDPNVSNLYEKLVYKVNKPMEQIAVKVGDYFEGVNVQAKLYGEYQNQLSITCDDVRVVNPQTQGVKQ